MQIKIVELSGLAINAQLYASGGGALVHWLKLPAGDRRFEPHFGLQVSNKQNVSSSLSRKDVVL